MFNLYQIVSAAQGGQAIDNLAGQFGLSRDQADSAVKALIPSLSTAFMTKVAQPGGLHEMAGLMSDDQHKQVYVDPNVAQSPDIQQKGGDIAGNIFGNSAILGQVVDAASTYTGIPAETLQRMLPVIVSLVMGGVATAMHNQGLGGMLGQLANGGLGSIFGQFGAGAGQPGQAGQAAAGGFPGMVGTILGSVFGGQHGAQPAPGQPGAAAPAVPPIVQAGIDALSKMFEPGVPPSPAHPANLGDSIDASMAAKR